MTNFPKITIITPTLNQGRFIERTMCSVLNQNYPNLEYIVIDGGSTDETISILQQYQRRLSMLVSEPDNGQTDAINKGIKLANGEIINWLNSDDYLEPGALQDVADAFEDQKTFVLCGFSEIHKKGQVLKKRTSGPGINYVELIASGHIMQPSTFFRKSFLDEVGPLPENLHFMMDHYLWLNYLIRYESNGIVYSDKILAHVEMHEDAKSVSKLDFFYQDKFLIYEALFKAHNLILIAPEHQQTKLPTFNSQHKNLISFHREINFNLLIDALFFRDEDGKRKKINSKIRELLIRYFPVRTLKYLLKKIIS